MSDAGADQEGAKPKGVFSTLMADGGWLFLKGEYKKALESYTAALTLKPDDRNCFVGRSKCYLQMGQCDNALRDAEASLKEDKSFFEGLYQKAEALYYMGEFEFALVFYHRGQKLRPQIQEFRLGIQKAQEAIENSVGSPSSVKLEIKGDLSFLQKDEGLSHLIITCIENSTFSTLVMRKMTFLNDGLVKRAPPITAIQHLTTAKKQQAQKTPKSEKTRKQLLREFYDDKKYLENLLKDKDLVKGKTKAGGKMKDVIQSCLTYLDTCTEFWDQEKPVCAQGGDPKLMKKNGGKPRCHAPFEPAQFLLRSLDDIDAELTCGNAKGGLEKAEEVLKMVKGWSEKEVPNRKEVMGSLHSCIGNALINLGDMDKALEHHQEDLEIAQECKLPDAMSRALDNVGRIYAQMGQFSQAIEFWEKKIPLVQGGLEKTWLFHEIGWCHLELSRYEDARDSGLRSVAASHEVDDGKWKMNANVLVAQSELKLGNFESSISHFERALTHAKPLEDNSAMVAIQKALDETKQRLSQ